VDNGVAHVARKDENPSSVANHGTVRANLANAVKGVSEGFKKELEIQGIGYRCSMRGTSIVLNVGFSHEVVIAPVEGVKITATDDTHIVVEGIDRQKVGQTAAQIHDTKRPEPYGGKGIRYKGEVVTLKEGKRATGGKK
jgi:large subunit ribosomal protein L6